MESGSGVSKYRLMSVAELTSVDYDKLVRDAGFVIGCTGKHISTEEQFLSRQSICGQCSRGQWDEDRGGCKGFEQPCRRRNLTLKLWLTSEATCLLRPVWRQW